MALPSDDQAWTQFIQGGCRSSSLEIFRRHLNVALGTPLWVPLLEQGLDHKDPEVPSSQNHSVICRNDLHHGINTVFWVLCYCTSSKMEQGCIETCRDRSDSLFSIHQTSQQTSAEHQRYLKAAG